MSEEAYLNKGIKEIIAEFPEVEEILEEFEIGCGSCGEGLCLLKDIVEIHYMEEDVEAELMARISNAIFPDKAVKFPKRKRKTKDPREINYSPPMKKMVDEHVLIKRWLALLPKIIENLLIGATRTSCKNPNCLSHRTEIPVNIDENRIAIAITPGARYCI